MNNVLHNQWDLKAFYRLIHKCLRMMTEHRSIQISTKVSFNIGGTDKTQHVPSFWPMLASSLIIIIIIIIKRISRAPIYHTRWEPVSYTHLTLPTMAVV